MLYYFRISIVGHLMHKLFILLVTLVLSASAFTLPSDVYNKSHITPSSAYSVYKEMREAKKLFLKGKLKESTPMFIHILQKSSKSRSAKNIEQYDYLYAHYGILTALKITQQKEEYIKLATKIISYLDKSTARGIWEEGELGQFQMKMYRTVGNQLALLLYESSQRKDQKKMKLALKYINKSEKYIRSDEDFYLKDTEEKISNALAGNPPLESEKESIKITKVIKSREDIKKDLNITDNPLKKK